MNKPALSEKEFEVINVIADGIRQNQRALSGQAGLSLGMTNLLLRRLVTKGYLRIRQLNRRKAEYLLTARGLAQKSQKTYNYTLKTIESLGLIRQKIRQALEERITPDIQQIGVVGQGDLADLAILALQDFYPGRFRISRYPTHPEIRDAQTLILDTSMAPPAPSDHEYTIHLMQKIAGHLNPRPSRGDNKEKS